MDRSVALLDNTIQVDRVKSGTRKRRIESLLNEFDFKIATSICLLEFKATVIRECVTIHNALRRIGRFTEVADRLTESSHAQAKLRGHILRNLVCVYGSSFVVTEEKDRRLAEKARLQLETVVRHLYKWFTGNSVDSVLKEEVACTRALEPPEKKRVTFGVLLPNCRRGENKFCHVEEFIRSRDRRFFEGLDEIVAEAGDAESNQLKRASDLFKQVLDNPDIELSHSQCRSAGDCLIALEGMHHATHALSTNAKDWCQVSHLAAYEFVKVSYPEERATDS